MMSKFLPSPYVKQGKRAIFLRIVDLEPNKENKSV